MAAIAAASILVKEIAPVSSGLKVVQVDLPAATVSADTAAITLSTYGITKFMGILGTAHTTANSVVVTEAPTTAVSSGVLTITVGGSAVTAIRSYLVWGV